jgi:hypothetical protein
LGKATWVGEWNGHSVRVSVSRQSRTRYAGEVRYRQQLGFRLRIECATGVATKLFFVPQGFASNFLVKFVYRLRRQVVLAEVPAELEGFRVVATDVRWGWAVLGHDEVVRQISYLLLEDATPALYGSVHLMPSELHFASPNLSREQLTGERLETALERVTWIAGAVDRLPPPAKPTELSRWERFAKEHGAVAGAIILVGILGVLTLGALALLGLSYLLFP